MQSLPPFAKGISRLTVVLAVVAVAALVPTQLLARGPDLCVWRHLFHIAACPSCGSTRAVSAFFHGHLRQALEFNRNVVVTGPALLLLLIHDAVIFARSRLPSLRNRTGSGHPRQEIA
jgi:Protein of unknown function (DUF2752)